MKTTLFIVLLLLISIVSEAQKSIISGVIKGIKNDTLSIIFLPLKMGETPIINKVVCVDGKLNFEVQLVAPMLHLARISNKKWKKAEIDIDPYRMERKDITFFLNSGDHINFIAEPELNGIYLQVFGNQINEQRNELLKILYPLHTNLNSACFRYADAKKTQDSLRIKRESTSIEKINNQINSGIIGFILQHPDWEISAEVLMILPPDSCYKYFGKLSPKVQSSFFGKHASELLFALIIGDPATPFSLPDQQGKLVSLSDFSGKYVVLDFWGSWCGWCLKEVPQMKKYYDKYKNKVEFVGIACKDNQKNWKDAIEKHQMNWINLLNVDEKLITAYGIKGYPSKIIINPDGVLIAKYVGVRDDFYAELDSLFKN